LFHRLESEEENLVKTNRRIILLGARLAVFCLFGVETTCVISQSPPAAGRDDSAVAAINSALTAMGGSPAWAQVSDAVVTGNCLTGSKNQTSANVRWTVQGPEFRYETDTDNAGPMYLSGHGAAVMAATAASLPLDPQYYSSQQPFNLPGLALLAALNNPTVGMSYVGSDTINGVPSVHVSFVQYATGAPLSGSQQDWWFDSTTGLPLRVTYSLPSQTGGVYIPMSWDYAGWSTEGQLDVPHQQVQSVNVDRPIQGCSILSVSLNTNPASTTFDAR
jgi:hypothetical protein